jgi:hypothetical protein
MASVSAGRLAASLAVTYQPAIEETSHHPPSAPWQGKRWRRTITRKAARKTTPSSVGARADIFYMPGR